MFALDAQSRRWMCRVGFVALCLVPTLALTSWGIARHLPSHALAYERRLSAALDVTVSVEAVTHPRPGVEVYTGLELRDPETQRLLAQVARLEVARDNDKYVLLASEPELQADAVPHCGGFCSAVSDATERKRHRCGWTRPAPRFTLTRKRMSWPT